MSLVRYAMDKSVASVVGYAYTHYVWSYGGSQTMDLLPGLQVMEKREPTLMLENMMRLRITLQLL